MDSTTQEENDLEKLKKSFLDNWKELHGSVPVKLKERVESQNVQKMRALVDKPTYEKQVAECKTCNDGRRIRLSNDRKHPYFGKSFPCPQCVSIEDRLRATGVPRDYSEWSLDQLDLDLNFLQIIREQIVAGESLVIFGKVGRGKTHVSVGLLREWLLDQGDVGTVFKPAKFLYFPDYLDDLRGMMSEGGENQSSMQYEKEIAAYPLLVIDDLGAERTTEWSQERTIKLIDSRLRNGKQTVVTTNLMSMSDATSRYGDRTASRLGGYRWKECVGRDHRWQLFSP